MVRPILFAAVLIAGVARAAAVNADCKEEKPGLAAKARVSCSEARKTALARVGSSEVKDAELEEEGGKLVYSFDLAVRGKMGIEEVQVDAVSGKIVSVHHEDAKAEAAEKEADKAKQKK
jgi:uncharacterized membrane protein YkoI